ncbi:MAG: hypothetical protein WCP33_01935, partial [Deltaproteobacteria bacterium]
SRVGSVSEPLNDSKGCGTVMRIAPVGLLEPYIASESRFEMAADIAALPVQQQELYKARPIWSVAASVVAVLGGTLGCLSLLLRKRWALNLLYASLAGVVLQDVGLFVVAGAAKVRDPVPFVLQGLVLVVAVGLIALGRLAARQSWLS